MENVWPRHFCISKEGRHLYVVEQKMNKLQVWDISPADGTVTLSHQMTSDNQPAVVFEI